MLKFKDYKYERPDMDKAEKLFNDLIEKFQAAESLIEQDKIMKEINHLRSEIDSMAQLVGIRSSINTVDEFYEKEQEFIDESMPIYEGIISNYYKVLVNSKFKNQLEEKWGKQ